MAQRILIAEDEEHIQKMVQSRLKSKGYKVLAVSDGAAVMKKIHSFRPDLLILDLTMPAMNGYQVCKEVRALPNFDHVPIIILSAWVRDKAGARDALADIYIAKPFDPEELLAEVHQLLNYGRDLF